MQPESPKEPVVESRNLANEQDAVAHRHKRKHSDTERIGRDDNDDGMDTGDEDRSRRKRNRSEAASRAGIEIKSPEQYQAPSKGHESRSRSRESSLSQVPQLTSPFARRTSGTPAHGVEIRIPSRPATPIATKDSFSGSGGVNSGSRGTATNNGSGGLPSATSTPKMTGPGPSPLIPQEAPVAAFLLDGHGSVPRNIASPAPPAPGNAYGNADGSTLQVDEDEWAAFEAEVVNALPRKSAKPDLNGAVYSAEPVSAKQGATGGQEQGGGQRAAEEANLEDEKEEATRALEDEFDEMQELDSRVRRLREKREALRRQPLVLPALAESDHGLISQPAPADTDTLAREERNDDNGGDDEDDDDDSTDWDAFRFRS